MKSPKVTKKVIEQIIDLSEFVDSSAISGRDDIKLSIGQSLVDLIIDRTESGRGRTFSDSGRSQEVNLKSPYSNQYSESVDFKAAGKSKNEVNMKLTGDMLESIQVQNMPGSKIKIVIEDETNILKAFNHITGDTVPRRPFFGVSKSEVGEVLKDYKSDLLEQIKDTPKKETERRRRLIDILEELEEDL